MIFWSDLESILRGGLIVLRPRWLVIFGGLDFLLHVNRFRFDNERIPEVGTITDNSCIALAIEDVRIGVCTWRIRDGVSGENFTTASLDTHDWSTDVQSALVSLSDQLSLDSSKLCSGFLCGLALFSLNNEVNNNGTLVDSHCLDSIGRNT